MSFQEWETPQWLFDKVIRPIAHQRWPDKDCMDMFASVGNAKSPHWISEGGELVTWPKCSWCFANPPFKLADKAVRHATDQVRRHKVNAILLFLARDMQTGYVRDCHDVWDKFLLTPRLGYFDPRTGKEENGPTFPSWLWISRDGIPLSRNEFVFSYLPTKGARNGRK